MKRAQEEKIIKIYTHNLRDYTHDKHKKIDDTPYGGGAGMVFKVEPIAEAIACLQGIKGSFKLKTRIILFSAKGRNFTQSDAKRLAQYERLILVCGRYEGVDERVAKLLTDEELSVGDYVLTGGEIPAMLVVDAVARLLPGVLGNADSVRSESHAEAGQVEYPQYTKPEKFRSVDVPAVLLSGNHAKIAKWKKEQSEIESKKRK